LKSVYSLNQYVKIIQQEVYNGDKPKAKKYYEIYKANGGEREYQQIVKGILSPEQRKKKSVSKRKKILKSVGKYFGF